MSSKDGLTTGSLAAEPQKESSLLTQGFGFPAAHFFWQLKAPEEVLLSLYQTRKHGPGKSGASEMPLTYSGFSVEGPRGQQTLLMQASQGLLLKLCQPAFALFICTRYFTWARCCIWNSKLKKRNTSQSTIYKNKNPRTTFYIALFFEMCPNS